MANSPVWKLYDSDGQYQACAKDLIILKAGMCVLAARDGATIRHGHSFICWTDGVDSAEFGDSYDVVERVCYDRIRERSDKAYDRIHGVGAAAAVHNNQ